MERVLGRIKKAFQGRKVPGKIQNAQMALAKNNIERAAGVLLGKTKTPEEAIQTEAELMAYTVNQTVEALNGLPRPQRQHFLDLYLEDTQKRKNQFEKTGDERERITYTFQTRVLNKLTAAWQQEDTSI